MSAWDLMYYAMQSLYNYTANCQFAGVIFCSSSKYHGLRWHFLVGSHVYMFSQRELNVHVRYMSSSVRLSVCRSSVTFVHPTQTIEIFGNVSTPFGTLATRWHPGKIYGARLRGTPPFGELNTRGVTEYSDFGPIERNISATVQDMS